MGKIGEDRQALAKAGPQPQPLPSIPLTSSSHLTGGALTYSRFFQACVLEEPRFFDPPTSMSITDN